MKKLSLLLTAIIFLGSCNSLLAFQVAPPVFCGYDHIILNSQSKVDEFANCPNLTYVPILTISGSNIHDLTPLSQLKHVSIFNISGNPMLESLDGLQNLTGIGSELNITGNPLLSNIDSLKNLSVNGISQLKITNNPSLSSLSGLQGIKSASWVEITGNSGLHDLHGLEGITQAGTVLIISNNNNLQSIDGLTAFTHAGNINIKNNPKLSSLAAFSHLTYVSDNLTLSNLPSLTTLAGMEHFGSAATVNISGNINLLECCGLYPYFGTLTSYGIPNITSVSISNNAPGCNSYLDVVTSCIKCNADMVLQSQAEVNAFPGCDTVWGNILIRGSGITNLSAFSSLKVVNGNFSIVNAHSLTSLAGLENLETTGELFIYTNANLQSVEALSNLSQAQPLKIINNPKLKLCCGVFPLLTDNPPATISISGNDVGCKTQQEIIAVCSQPPPQFVDLELSMSAPTAAPIYTSYPIVLTLKNVGTLLASGVKVKFAKPVGVVYTGGNEATPSQGNFNPFSDEVWNVGSIPAGGTVTLTVSYFLLQNTLPVAYAQVTAMGQSDIDSTPNNGTPPAPNEDDEASSAGTPPPPPPAQPDLTLTDINAPASISPGNVNFTFNLKNIGTGAVQGSYQIGAYLSTDNALSPNDLSLSTLSEQNTAIGSFARTVSFSLSTGFAAGNYYLIIKADVINAIAEGNENNNIVSAPITVTGGVCSGTLILATQSDVNAFPNCPVFNGDITISGQTIQDLTPLSVLNEVSNSLIIQQNPLLTSLSGLEHLTAAKTVLIKKNSSLTSLSALTHFVGTASTSLTIEDDNKLTSLAGLQGVSNIGQLHILYNDVLVNLNGLNNLSNVAGQLRIASNPELLNTTALNSLQSVGTDLIITGNGKMATLSLPALTQVGHDLTISDNDKIISLNGLPALTSINGKLTLQGNNLLADIDALQDISSLNSLVIKDNTTLAACCGVFPLLNTNGVSGTIDIQNNLLGCNSKPEIINACMTSGQGIDLALVVTAPASAPAYTNYQVLVKINNFGSIPATGVKVVCQKPNGVVYTGGNEFTASQGTFGPLTGQEWVVGTIAPGATATLTLNYFLLQSTLPLVYAQVTAANESDTDSTPNNGTPPTPHEDDEATSTLAPPPPPTQPDLTLTNLVAPAPTSTGSGSFTFVLKNIGTAAVQGSYQIGSFLSTDNVLSADDYALATTSEQNTNIDIYGRTGSFIIPTGFTPGNYYLIVKVDVGNVIAEGNENNNTAAVPITVMVNNTPLTDLYLSNLTATASSPPLVPGGSINITSISLYSYIPPATNYTVKYKAWLSTDNQMSADDIATPLNYSRTYTGAIGSASNLALADANGLGSIGIPATVPAGNYYLLVKVDADNTVAESDESNNIVNAGQFNILLPSGDPCSTITITPSIGNLTITGVNAPHAFIKVFRPNWTLAFECLDGSCASPQVVTGLGTGSHYVEVKLMNANWGEICTKSQNVGVSNLIGPKEDRLRLNFDRFYPNPAKYTVTMDVFSPKEQDATLDFYDQQGRLVESREVFLEEGQNNIEQFVFDWKSGAYNVIVRGEQTGLPAYGRFLKVWEE